MIHLKIRVKIHSDKQKEFEQAVTKLINIDEASSENSIFNLSKSLDDQHLYLYSEEWESRDLLDEHMKTDKFHILLGAMKVLGEIEDSKIIYSSGEESLVI